MSNELSTLNERIAERIGKDLVDLIPPEQWQALVDKEIHTFINVTAPKIIQEELKEAYKVRVTTIVDQFTGTDTYDEMTQEYINGKLKEFLGAAGGVMFAATLQPTMQMVLQDLRNRLGY